MKSQIEYICDECKGKIEIVTNLKITATKTYSNFSYINAEGKKESFELDSEENNFCPNCESMNTFYILANSI